MEKPAPASPAEVDGIPLGVVPAQRRGIEARRRLFEAALDEFNERGVEGSRVENVVAAAETSWGTFFRYFPRKEDVLLFASAEQFAQHAKPAYQRAIADSEGTARAAGHAFFAELTRPRTSPRILVAMIDETVRHPGRFAAILDDGELPLIGLLADLIAVGQERGEISAAHDPFESAVVMGAGVMFSTTRVLAAVAEKQQPISEIGAIARRSFDLIWTGLSAEPQEP